MLNLRKTFDQCSICSFGSANYPLHPQISPRNFALQIARYNIHRSAHPHFTPGLLIATRVHADGNVYCMVVGKGGSHSRLSFIMTAMNRWSLYLLFHTLVAILYENSRRLMGRFALSSINPIRCEQRAQEFFYARISNNIIY